MLSFLSSWVSFPFTFLGILTLIASTTLHIVRVFVEIHGK